MSIPSLYNFDDNLVHTLHTTNNAFHFIEPNSCCSCCAWQSIMTPFLKWIIFCVFLFIYRYIQVKYNFFLKPKVNKSWNFIDKRILHSKFGQGRLTRRSARKAWRRVHGVGRHFSVVSVCLLKLRFWFSLTQGI